MFDPVTTTPVPRIDLDAAARTGGFAAGAPDRLSETTREAIGLTDTVAAALEGLTGAKVEHAYEADAEELSIGYIVAYLRHHQFSEAELIDVVWEVAATLDRRDAMTGGVVETGT